MEHDQLVIRPSLWNTFDAVYCINLNRRPDRWQSFVGQLPQAWPFRPVARMPAIDGHLVSPPSWWKQGEGAWGCYRSHLGAIERGLSLGLNSILLLEDDAAFCQDFVRKTERFFESIPHDWGMVYLGGQHLNVGQNPPVRINDEVFRPFNVNRTHAYGLRGRTMKEVYKHLCKLNWFNGNHIDHHLGRFHQQRRHKVYCPPEWLIGQADGSSNVSGRENPELFWEDAVTIDATKPEEQPFVAVVGLHESGSRCIGGLLYHLGAHLDDVVEQQYACLDKQQPLTCDVRGLARLCNKLIPLPATALVPSRTEAWNRLRTWINQKKREASQLNRVAAGESPQLCQLGPQLISICGTGLRLIIVERPVDDCSVAASRKYYGLEAEALFRHQRWLAEGLASLRDQVADSHQLLVPREALLSETADVIRRIAAFVGLSPTTEQLAAAEDWVRAAHCDGDEVRHRLAGVS